MEVLSQYESIEIKKPCQQNWQMMSPTGKNKFCGSCQKTVVDFSTMTDAEVLGYFRRKKAAKTCGRFEKTQLRQLNMRLEHRNSRRWTRVLAFTVLLTVFAANYSSTFAQNTDIDPEFHHNDPFEVDICTYKIIESFESDSTFVKGKIIEIEGEPAAFVNIAHKALKTGLNSGFEGEFHYIFPEENRADSLEFSYVGYKTCLLPLEAIENKEIEIQLDESPFLLGELCIIKRPLHKRFWDWLTHPRLWFR